MINYGNILTYVNCFRIMALHINLLKTPVQPSQTFRPIFTALLWATRRKLRLSNLSGFRAPLRSEDGLLTVRVNALAFVPRNTGNLNPDCEARFVFPIRALFYIATRLSCANPELRHSDEGFRS